MFSIKIKQLVGIGFSALILTGCATSAPEQTNALAKDALLKERPNILWLTFEDTTADEWSLYGNKNVPNPTLEALAETSMVFEHAYSNAPYCSPARSSLISGSYATTFGSDHHRAAIKAPKDRIFFPKLLRDAGYFTTNNNKRDYNVKLSKTQLSEIWDEYDKKASYNSKNRKADQPFFAVFNGFQTHMSRLTSYHMDERRDFSKDGIPKSAHPGEWLPNLEEVRSDYQFHLEGVFDIDRWVQLFLDDLEEKGLADNTIIFIYSDHGGSSPRGKGYLFRTGLQVPLLVHVPEKYRKMYGKNLEKQLVSFVDFAPTVLSLAGVKPPKQMQGHAFMGAYAESPRDYVYNFRTNQELHFDPWRSVMDGRFNYIKTYLKRKPIQLRNAFQWGMPSNMALDVYAKENPKSEFAKKFYNVKQGEYLFDMQADPSELNNLAADDTYAEKAKELRAQVEQHVVQSGDLGFIPVALKKGKNYGKWFDSNFGQADYYKLINQVAEATPKQVPVFSQALNTENTLAQFWGAQGFAELAAFDQLTKAPQALLEASQTADPIVKAVALEALVYLGDSKALKQLLNMAPNDHMQSSLETIAYIKPEAFKPYMDYLKGNAKGVNRVILSNLGQLSPFQVKQGVYKKGLKVNKLRRPLLPQP